MSASIGAASSRSHPEPIKATFQRLQRLGFDDPEAANLTALKNGLGITAQPWTIRGLACLLFLRESRRAGRRWADADDRADRSDETYLPRLLGDRMPISAVGDQTRAPAVPSKQGFSGGRAVGASMLLTLLDSMWGHNATFDRLRGSAPPQLDAADADREDG